MTSDSTQINWQVKKFENLDKMELYGILKLRVNVFVVEQACPYPELDDKDQECFHLFASNQSAKIIGLTRIAPPETIYKEPSIGRVVTHPEFRNLGLGKELMNRSIEFCLNTFEGQTIKIAAQAYLEKFYKDLGFKRIGENYIWDGIDHLDMIYSVNSKD